LSSRWDEFNRKYEDSVNSLKPRLIIIIYGSYFPESEKNLLECLKNFLISNGYESTYIVEDFDEQGLNSLELSQRCLLFADVNFLIFTEKGKRLGLVRELAFIALSPEMITKAAGCVAYDEIFEQQSSISDLSARDLGNLRLVRHEYGTRAELEYAVLSEAFWQLRRLSPILSRRPPYGI